MKEQSFADVSYNSQRGQKNRLRIILSLAAGAEKWATIYHETTNFDDCSYTTQGKALMNGNFEQQIITIAQSLGLICDYQG